MTTIEKFCEKLGITAADFAPDPEKQAAMLEQRISETEDAVIELAELITEVQNG